MVSHTMLYRHELATVASDFFSGLPVAWAIVDKEDIHTLQAFFKSLNEHVPTATVNTLMTDYGTGQSSCWCPHTSLCTIMYHPTDPALPVAFMSVYPTATHLLCRWHIDRLI